MRTRGRDKSRETEDYQVSHWCKRMKTTWRNQDFACGHPNTQSIVSRIPRIKTEKGILSEKQPKHVGSLALNLVFIFHPGTETTAVTEKGKSMTIII